ncbi:MAG: hypothetical protein ACXWRE_02650 [Pseudobdellovibrionaceae bacterium]
MKTSRIWILSVILTLTTSGAFSAGIYRAPYAQKWSDRYRNLMPQEGLRCAMIFTSINSIQEVSVGQIIGFADKHFARRGWSSDFINERIELVKDFPNSEYYYTEKNGAMTGTLAVTYAEYTKEGFTAQGLPMQKSLNSSELAMPLDSSGRGMISELRTYAMDHEIHRETRTALFFAALSSVLRRYQKYPELLDQPVIYTYGDEVSLKLYGQMGFKNMTEVWSHSPIDHAGSKWWTLAITPNKLKELIDREEHRFGHFAANENESVLLPNGKKVQVMSFINKEMNNGQLSPVSLRYLSADVEIADSLWAAKGSDLAYTAAGQLLSVSKLAKPYRIPNLGIVADVDSSIEFFSQNGQPRVIEKVRDAFEIAPNVWVRPGDKVQWTSEGDYSTINNSFYNPKLYPPTYNGGKTTRPMIRPKTINSYIGTNEVE